MAGITHVVIVLGGACDSEHVVATDRVLDDFNEWLLIGAVELCVQAWPWIGGAHQRPRGGRIQAAFQVLVESGLSEHLEVRALAAIDIDDLNEFSRLHLVGICGSRRDALLETRVGERIR